ncbi:AAA family ATPase [Nocardia sp. NPDC004151]|uniref:helix-turn-helix transcriptional regulator n=1 Tax=Nocardia sp. NPDC004151 TaxID=3364304 RepID=UPI003677A69B
MVSFPGSSVLVGRAAEVSAVVEAVGDARTQTVLIAGEAGIGKSRLVVEFTERLGGDALVLLGRCPELGAAGVAYAPFLTVLRGLVKRLGGEAVATLLPPHPALANWLPQLAVHTGGAAPEADRIRLFGEILTLLEQLAMARPVVLVLEDLHWADDASRELLTFLAANLADANALLVGTYRPGEAGPLRGLVAELRRNPGVHVLELHPLTRHEVGRQLAALLGREPGTALITKVFDRSGGNPLFVEALGQCPDELPADLADLLLGFQTGLSAQARAVVAPAAVLGSPIHHDLLAATVDLPPDELPGALRELVDRHLLLTTDTGYEFRHGLIRQAIYDHLLPIERTRLHTRAAAALHARGDALDSESHADLARHARAAGDLDRALRAYWSATAGVPATHPERLRLLEQILALWDRVPAPTEVLPTTKLSVLEQIVDVAVACGATERGIAAADAALALLAPAAAAAPATLPVWSQDAAAVGELVSVHVDGGTVAGEDGEIDYAGADSERSARMYRRRAYLRATTGTGPGADLERALALMAETPDSLERAEALVQSAAARVFQGDAAGSAARAREALAIARRLGADALVARAHAHLGLAGAAAAGGSLTADAADDGDVLPEGDGLAQPFSRNTGEGAIESCARPGGDALVGSGARPIGGGPGDSVARPASDGLAGDGVWPGGDASAGDGARSGRDLGAGGRERVAGAASETDWALEHFAQAHRAAALAGDARIVVDVATWESAVLVGAGRYEAAIAAVRQGLRAAHESFRFAESAPILFVKWGQALAALGRWDEARAVVDETQLAQLPPLSRAALLVCFGRISLATGDFVAAREGAVTAARLLGDSRWAAQYRLELAALNSTLALVGDDEGAAATELIRVLEGGDGVGTLFAHPHEAWPLVVLGARITGAPPELLALGDTLPTASPVDAAQRAAFTAHLAGTAARWSEAVAAWRGVGRPYDVAIALLGLAEAAAAEGNRIEAVSALRECLDVAAALGAVPLAAAAAALAERARLPLEGSAERAPKVKSGTMSGRSGLTARELDVLHLVAKGLSNRALAAELFISANTAGVHVSRILAKLGVSSRTEAAAFAHEHGLLTAGDDD